MKHHNVIAPLLLTTALLPAQTRVSRPPSPGQPAAPLRLQRTVPLPGVQGRLTRIAADADGRRAFVAAPSCDCVAVVSLQQGRLLQLIPGLKRPVALAWNRDLGRLYVSSREDGSVSIFDGQSLKLLKRQQLDSAPDQVRIGPKGRQVFVASTSAILIFDADLKPVGAIRLEGQPSDFLLGSSGQRIWANMSLSKAIAVIDVPAKAVRRSLPATTQTSTGSVAAFTLDEKGSRLLLATRRPSKFQAMNADSGVIGNTTMSRTLGLVESESRLTINDPESISFDPATRRVFISGNDTSIDVIQQVTADKYDALARVPAVPGARTSHLVPELGLLVVAVSPQSGTAQASLLVYEVGG